MLIEPFNERIKAKIEKMFEVRDSKTSLEFLKEFRKLYAKGGTEHPIFMGWYSYDYLEHLYFFEKALRKREYETAVRELEILHNCEKCFYLFGTWQKILNALDNYIV